MGQRDPAVMSVAQLTDPTYRKWDETGRHLVSIAPEEAAELLLGGWETDVDACTDRTCHICEGRGIVIMREPD